MLRVVSNLISEILSLSPHLPPCHPFHGDGKLSHRYDFPWQLHRVVPFGLYGGAPRHERHHREGLVYMQKFGTYLDEAFGFVPGGKKDLLAC